MNGDDLKQKAESKVEAKVQEVTRHVGCMRDALAMKVIQHRHGKDHDF